MTRPAASSLVVVALLAVGPAALAQPSGHPEHRYFGLGDLELERGETLPDARVLYVTHGELDGNRDNAVLVPSWYGGNHHGYDFLIGPGRALDPADHFIIVTEMFASGGSSSPSTMEPPQTHEQFPTVTIRDNVEATYRLVTERFGLDHLRAVIGFSMGAQQAFQWAVSHPDFMEVIVPIAGTAKTYPHGVVRLESALTLITHDPAILAGDDALSRAGARAWTLHWAAWTRSTEWWRLGLFQSTDTPTVDAFLERASRPLPDLRPHDRVVQGRAWQRHDVGETPGFEGDVGAALAPIRARVVYLPGQTDMYFPLTDAEYERQFIRDLDFRPIPSLWGHTAGAGPNPEDAAFLNDVIAGALAR